MKFSCDQCHAQYMIADEKVGDRGVKVKCKKCSNIIVVRPQVQVEAPSAATVPVSPAAGVAAAGEMGSMFAKGGGDFGTSPGLGADSGQGVGAVGGFGGFGGSFSTESGSGFGFNAPATTDNSGLSAGPSAAAPAPQGDLGDFNLGALSSPSAAPRRPAGEKEWYVAIEDSQVGPIDVSEIEQRWDERELSEDSLAWKAGMADWMPLAEVPELAYLVSERPHPKQQAYAAASPSAPAAAANNGGPASFGGSGREETAWKPSAASALSSLVQEELVAAAAPKPAAAPPPEGVPDLGMPGFGAGDLFSGGNGAGASAGAGAVVRPDPFSGPAPAWSVPVVPHRSSGLKWMIPVFGLLGVAIVGLLGFLVWQQIRMPGRVVAPVAVPTPAVATPAATTQPTPAATTAAQPNAATAAAPGKPEPRVAATPTPPRRHEPKEGRTETPREKPRDSAADGPKEKPRDKPKNSEDPLAGIEGGGNAAPVKPSLTKQDVMEGVKKNVGAVAPCLKEARAKNEIPPKQYTFTLDWIIRPDGSVAKPVLKGPADVLGTSLPGCFAVAMKRWSFPASQKETPISNFPFGPINIR